MDRQVLYRILPLIIGVIVSISEIISFTTAISLSFYRLKLKNTWTAD